MANLLLTLVLVVVILFLMFGVLQIMSMIAARAGGWIALAEAHPAPGPLEGKRLKLKRVSVGGVIYRNSITVGIGDPGLHIRTTPLDRAFHTPLLISWPAITEAKAEDLGKYFAQALTGGTPDGGLLVRLSLKAIGDGLNANPHLKNLCFKVPLPKRAPVELQLLIDIREIGDRLELA